jgi:hypothetical protein
MMKIELIIDENCFSISTFDIMKNRLAKEFSTDEIKIISFQSDRQRLRDLGIRLLPAWLVNDEVLRINPMDYDGLRQRIKERF